jgi:hypothetical protein
MESIFVHDQFPKDGNRRSLNDVTVMRIVNPTVENAIDILHLPESFFVNRFDTTPRDREDDTNDRRRTCKTQQTSCMSILGKDISKGKRNIWTFNVQEQTGPENAMIIIDLRPQQSALVASLKSKQAARIYSRPVPRMTPGRYPSRHRTGVS